MLFTPSPMMLKLLYTRGSLHNTPEGVAFSIKNRLDTVRITRIDFVQIDGQRLGVEEIAIDLGEGDVRPAMAFNADEAGFTLPVGQSATFHLVTDSLAEGLHTIQVQFAAEPFGELNVEVEDSITLKPDNRPRIPRADQDDYSDAAIAGPPATLPRSLRASSSTTSSTTPSMPTQLQGNCEHFMGVAQIPVGLAGPLHVNGEHAQGDFLIPMATTEGTLVASYNRGIQLLNLCGGVKCTVIGDAMQRAPVFVFDDARGARDFGRGWRKKLTASGPRPKAPPASPSSSTSIPT